MGQKPLHRSVVGRLVGDVPDGHDVERAPELLDVLGLVDAGVVDEEEDLLLAALLRL